MQARWRTLSVHIPVELTAQPCDNIQGLGVPPAQRVDRDGHKLQALSLALLSLLPVLEVVAVLNCVYPVHGAPSDQGGLECIGVGKVQAGVLAI